MTSLIEYPCPDCGHDGPHPVVDEYEDGCQTFECVGCFVEVIVDPAGQPDSYDRSWGY